MSGTVTLENKWPVLGLSGVPSEDGCQACPGVGLVAVTRGARRCGAVTVPVGVLGPRVAIRTAASTLCPMWPVNSVAVCPGLPR